MSTLQSEAAPSPDGPTQTGPIGGPMEADPPLTGVDRNVGAPEGHIHTSGGLPVEATLLMEVLDAFGPVDGLRVIGTRCVGSQAYLAEAAHDVDIVCLLSWAGPGSPGVLEEILGAEDTRDVQQPWWPMEDNQELHRHLELIRTHLLASPASNVESAVVIKATVPIIKLAIGTITIDVLPLYVDNREGDGSSSALRIDDAQPIAVRESVLLSEYLTRFFQDPGPRALLVQVRDWAHRRHIYGTRYGYPGGAAWSVMVMVYVQTASRFGAPMCLNSFRLFLKGWPWPLPMTTRNAHWLLSPERPPPKDELVDGMDALCGSIGRHTSTCCVVPLPCGTTKRNMTQTVGYVQLMAMQSEARYASCKGNVVEDFLATDETSQWPVYCVIDPCTKPSTPVGWDDLIRLRMVQATPPQLLAAGMDVRVFCVPPPGPIVFALWIQKDVFEPLQAQGEDIAIPIGRRLLPVLFAVVQAACEHFSSELALETVLPKVELTRAFPQKIEH